MAKISILPYTSDRYERWNSFVTRSNEGTIFHRLDFLAYHGAGFERQEKHLMWYKGQPLFAVMPMAILEREGRRIAHPPYGGSYGGPVFEKPIDYADSQEVVSSLLDYLAHLDVTACRLTLPIFCCFAKYSETFRLALLEHGFRCVNRDISSVVCLNRNSPVSETMTSNALNMPRKARKAGVATLHRGSVADFWILIEKTFEKHHAEPTHTLQEFRWLCDHLPEDVYVDVAYLRERPIAGIGYFVINQRVTSSFYLCQNPEFAHLQAQSLLIHDGLIRSQEMGFRWFDFGTSSLSMQGRENIFHLKESFGAAGFFRDTYMLGA